MPRAVVTSTAIAGPRVEILGVRHHGPGSARSVLAALEELDPDHLIIEGPPELDALISLALDPQLVPPVAGLVYAVDEPRLAAFYPFAVFSPEWVALRWALTRGIPVQFADLPATHELAMRGASDHSGRRPRRSGVTVDPLGTLAGAAGYDDPERWWEDVVEHRRTSSLEQFRDVSAAMAEIRAAADGEDPGGDGSENLENSRREAAMRKAIRTALRAGRERVAFVCGAFHAPALEPAHFPTMTRDNALLAKLPKVKVAATWAPWSTDRLGQASGYGAGVRAPGWYEHLFVTPDPEVVPAWFVRVARALRAEQLDASTASAVEAARLAEALAALRGRPSVGLSEVTDAARATLADGSELPLRLIDRTLVVGDALGTVPDSTPMVPLAADLAKQQKSLRLKVSATATVIELDLRREAQLARSVLLHRLSLLGIDWGEQVETGRTTGTFKEAWQLEWHPGLALAVIEANLYGNTVLAAAEARVAQLAGESNDLATLGSLIEHCLLADLPGALRSVVAVLAERTARHHDTEALLRTIEPLARTCRYGDVRGVDVGDVAHVLSTVVLRASIGLRAACAALDDDGAAAMRTAIESAQRGVALMDDDQLRAPWYRALASVAEDDGLHGDVSGRANRLLLDAGEISHQTAATRLSRHLSRGTPGRAAAAWLDGFLTGEALLLLHSEELLGMVDAWLGAVPEEAFEDLLPLVRRTFARYQPAERRQIGTHVRNLGTGRKTTALADDTDIDLDRAAPAVATVARLLGLAVAR